MRHARALKSFELGRVASGAFSCTHVFTPRAVTFRRPPTRSLDASCRGLGDVARSGALSQHAAAGKNRCGNQRHPAEQSPKNTTRISTLRCAHQRMVRVSFRRLKPRDLGCGIREQARFYTDCECSLGLQVVLS